MKKRMMAAVLVVLALALSACGGEAALELDVNSLAEDLRNVCGEDLYTIDAATIDLVYGGLDVEEAAVYASSGATAEEVAVFRSADEQEAAKVLETAQQRVSDRKESYADYAPEEAAKLEDAIVEQHGRYVIVCVTGDTDAAREIIDNYVK